ncbi:MULTISPECIES: nucleotide sugar dehydrogenase [Hyphomicrobium]|uniref:nucleotide sugar dehydrogenase n=1 Tax=Hyphomicrobium TaxID=81 RepID=UPI00037387C3|nr:MULTISPECIES: nucleotide sugar dehydrogenase [Hyphomicrobium]WBT37281.1 nucleotide sugar dehydrogenase [Hyphomicrobium sp. DMF-1]HML43766.1 nucleotide sugar dehydrogenase [Hyphomicrobium zavarzinii]
MKIAIFGLGYVGITGAACLVREGHTVVGVEINERKSRAVASGRSPIFEPGVEELLAAGVREGRLTVVADARDAIADADIAMVCVGTPSAPDGAHNMSYVMNVSKEIATALADSARAEPLTVVYRSTMRPGSIEELIAPVFESVLGEKNAALVELVYNPEFLRESTAVADYLAPPKIVVGTKDGKPSTRIEALYSTIDAPTFVTRFREAEFTKFVDNTFHAVKVAFANEIGRFCVALGIDASKVHEIFISDRKLNISPYYCRPGGAFGGSCLPKDVRALQYLSDDTGSSAYLIESLLKSNEAHKRFLYELATKDLPKGSHVLMIGLAFKAGTDDLREAPQLDLARRLLQNGYRLSILDPAVKPDQLLGQNLGYAFAHLPNMAKLLVSEEVAASTTYDRVIDTNGRARGVALMPAPLININAL